MVLGETSVLRGEPVFLRDKSSTDISPQKACAALGFTQRPWDNNPPTWGSCAAVIVSVTTGYFPPRVVPLDYALKKPQPLCPWQEEEEDVDGQFKRGGKLLWSVCEVRQSQKTVQQKHLIWSTCQVNWCVKWTRSSDQLSNWSDDPEMRINKHHV